MNASAPLSDLSVCARFLNADDAHEPRITQQYACQEKKLKKIKKNLYFISGSIYIFVSERR